MKARLLKESEAVKKHIPDGRFKRDAVAREKREKSYHGSSVGTSERVVQQKAVYVCVAVSLSFLSLFCFGNFLILVHQRQAHYRSSLPFKPKNCLEVQNLNIHKVDQMLKLLST